MSKRTIVLYLPDGKTQVYVDIKSFVVKDDGSLWIVPNDTTAYTKGKSVITNLPFTITESD